MNAHLICPGYILVLTLNGCGSPSKGEGLFGDPPDAVGGTTSSGGNTESSAGSGGRAEGNGGSSGFSGGVGPLGGTGGANPDVTGPGTEPRGSIASGGSARGGAANGGNTSGGNTSGGSTNGGAANGGTANGGTANGGTANGGTANGGTTNGGASTTSQGGNGTLQGGSGGSAGAAGATARDLSCAQLNNALFCEDFESLPPGPALATHGWSPVTDNGSLSIDGVHATGKNALHVHTRGGGKAYIQLSPFTPPGNSFFGRMRAWVTAFPSAPDYAPFTLVEVAGSQPGLIRPIGGQYVPGKGALWGVGSDGGPTGGWTNWKESARAEARKALCIEWQLAASSNAIRVWIDGEEKAELFVNTKQHGGNAADFVFPTFSRIWFGWWLYQGGTTPPEFDLWLDDIALSAQRLGC